MKVQSVERVFDIIEYVAGQRGGISLSEIASNLELPVSTVHRLLGSLVERGYVEQPVSSGKYKIGIRFIELSSQYLRGLELRTEAVPLLQELNRRGGHPCFMAAMMDDEVVYLERLDERGTNLRNYSIIGQRRPLYNTGLGKAILMGLPTDTRDEIISRLKLVPKTATTITNPDKLKAELDLSAKRGYTRDNEEDRRGFRCIAAPIRDYRNQVIASISTSWTEDSFATVDEDKTARLVMETAVQISRRMGFNG
jgi:DNA-binding IclR family transcriptional regulator